MRKKSSPSDTIGKEMRRIRQTKGIQVKEVAECLGVSSTYISNIERDRNIPSNELIEKMAVFYGISEKKICRGFSIVTDCMKEELTTEYGFYDLLYELTENEQINQKDKQEFYKKVHALYEETFNK